MNAKFDQRLMTFLLYYVIFLKYNLLVCIGNSNNHYKVIISIMYIGSYLAIHEQLSNKAVSFLLLNYFPNVARSWNTQYFLFLYRFAKHRIILLIYLSSQFLVNFYSISFLPISINIY